MSKKKKEEAAPAAEGEEDSKALSAKKGGEGGEGEAAEGGEGAEGEEGKKGFGLKKIILFVVLPLLLLGGIGAGLYFTGIIGKSAKTEEAAAAEDGKHEGGKHEAKVKLDKDGKPIPAGAYFLQIPDMLVNLSSPDGQNRYLRLNVQLELASEEDKKAVEAVMPRVIDQFQTYLRELRVKDLRGSAGIYRLQIELLNRVNTAAAPTEVKNVLFQEILIQ